MAMPVYDAGERARRRASTSLGKPRVAMNSRIPAASTRRPRVSYLQPLVWIRHVRGSGDSRRAHRRLHGLAEYLPVGAEIIALAVMHALLQFTNETRWLRFARMRLLEDFPFIPAQSGDNPHSAATTRIVRRQPA